LIVVKVPVQVALLVLLVLLVQTALLEQERR
jgi:hypothetical protein